MTDFQKTITLLDPLASHCPTLEPDRHPTRPKEQKATSETEAQWRAMLQAFRRNPQISEGAAARRDRPHERRTTGRILGTGLRGGFGPPRRSVVWACRRFRSVGGTGRFKSFEFGQVSPPFHWDRTSGMVWMQASLERMSELGGLAE